MNFDEESPSVLLPLMIRPGLVARDDLLRILVASSPEPGSELQPPAAVALSAVEAAVARALQTGEVASLFGPGGVEELRRVLLDDGVAAPVYNKATVLLNFSIFRISCLTVKV